MPEIILLQFIMGLELISLYNKHADAEAHDKKIKSGAEHKIENLGLFRNPLSMRETRGGKK